LHGSHPAAHPAVNPRHVKTSPSHPGCRLSRPSAAMFPSPPPRGGEGGSSGDPFGRSSFSATPNRTPRHLTSPSLGSESGPVVQDGTAVLPAYPSLAPRGFAPPSNGQGLGAGRPVGSGSTALPHTPLQNATGNRSNSPSWADVVRNGHRLSSSPPKATFASARSPPLPSPTPTTSPFTEQSLSLDDHDLPQSPAILPTLTPDR
jgi:hypothetical protein